MSIVTEIIDIIRARYGVTRVDNLMEYKQSYVEADMQPNTLVPYSILEEAIPAYPDVRVKIEPGTIPTTLVNGVDFNSPSLLPFVLQTANPTYPSVDDTKLTTEGQSLRVDYQYSDNTLTVLESIDVYVVDNTVDTWVRVI